MATSEQIEKAIQILWERTGTHHNLPPLEIGEKSDRPVQRHILNGVAVGAGGYAPAREAEEERAERVRIDGQTFLHMPEEETEIPLAETTETDSHLFDYLKRLGRHTHWLLWLAFAGVAAVAIAALFFPRGGVSDETLQSAVTAYMAVHSAEFVGPAGAPGVPGARGIQGIPGPQGIAGLQGSTGAAGQDGRDAPALEEILNGIFTDPRLDDHLNSVVVASQPGPRGPAGEPGMDIFKCPRLRTPATGMASGNIFLCAIPLYESSTGEWMLLQQAANRGNLGFSGPGWPEVREALRGIVDIP